LFFNNIPSGAEGYIPAAQASKYYRSTIPLTRNGFAKITGAGLLTRIHYTGVGNPLIWQFARFSTLEGIYFTVSDAAAGGLVIQAAQEGCSIIDVYCENQSTPGNLAYGLLFQSSWSCYVRGGRFRGRYGIWGDQTNFNTAACK